MIFAIKLSLSSIGAIVSRIGPTRPALSGSILRYPRRGDGCKGSDTPGTFFPTAENATNVAAIPHQQPQKGTARNAPPLGPSHGTRRPLGLRHAGAAENRRA
ncbi:hypothetical protein GCM10011324_30870 [Allosediminivita pacifica]|nr:hypothetical protein GCM10011324_30870 [Allosediminivita pacifica]